jgi:glutathione S-transferase
MASVNVVEELGIECSLIEVSFKRNQHVDELERLNPLGLTPVLVTDDGQVITQSIAVLEYLADQKPAAKLLAAAGTAERAQTLAWVSFGVTEFKGSFIPAFNAEEMAKDETAQGQIEAYARETIEDYLKYVEQSLNGKSFILGTQFTIADCYLFVALGWSEWIDIDLNSYPEISAYRKRVSARPAIQRALAREQE